jgi:tRNA threonylcarbamoyl adenosine modification protein (Sua5/YciO/YrdC/YwlC family)
MRVMDNRSVQRKLTTPVFSDLNDPALIDIIEKGGVGVLLTDTVYGIVGSALNRPTALRVIDAKGRKYKPGTLVAASVEQLIDLGIKADGVHSAQRFWPGAVSVVLPTEPGLEHLHLGKDSLVVRIPDKPELLNLLERVGPLLTTSANRPDEPTVTSIEEAQEIFGNSLNFYVDGGPLSTPLASTIIKIENGIIEILRQGAVAIDPELA